MKRSTKTFLGLFALLLLLAVGATLLLRHGFPKESLNVPSRTVLQLDLERAIPETAPEGPFTAFRIGRTLTLRNLTETLERAADDARVAGLVARIGAAPFGVAQLQEIRDAVKAFREKKKFAVAYSETFGEF